MTERGIRFPTRQFAQRADAVLDAAGALVIEWDVAAQVRHEAQRKRKLLAASAADSLRILRDVDSGDDVDDIGSRVNRLAIDYLGTPVHPMLQSAIEVRDVIASRLARRDYSPGELKELMTLLGRVQGVLTYAALDLGDSHIATVHAEAGWAAANRADDNELRVWWLGTQSLVARFERRYQDAEQLVLAGLRYPAPGTGRIRLLAGLAQSRANLGDSDGTNDALSAASRARRDLATADSAPGLFTFSAAKQHYYAGSSLMWLPDRSDLQVAADEAQIAVDMWRESSADDRSLDDEALAQIYRATALIHLGNLDGAGDALAPVLELPREQLISWIVNRLTNVRDLLGAAPFEGSVEAASLGARIQSRLIDPA